MATQDNHGFTIIEVLIVLAIAGFILTVVFMAVPALKRMDRNTRRRHDASLIASQRVQYNIDNKTAMSAGGFDCSPPLTSKTFCTYIDGSLSYFEGENVTFHNSGNSAPTTIPEVTDPDDVITDTYLTCNENRTAAVVAPQPRSMVVLFMIETTSGAVQQCIDSGVVPTS